MAQSALVFLLSASAVLAVAEIHPFTFISDVHLDASYGTPSATGPCTNASAPRFGRPGCDSPIALVDSLLTDIRNQPGHSHILFTGDWLRHNSDLVPPAQSKATFAQLASLLSALPHTTIPAPNHVTASLGNNDFIPDYSFNVNAASDPLLVNMSQTLYTNSLIDAAENETFSKCAYYSRKLTRINLMVLVVNTIVYHHDLTPPITPAAVPDPCSQFAFMEATLKAANSSGTKVIVISHVPPTLNAFDVISGKAPKTYFQTPYWQRYTSILRTFAHVIPMQFYGHTHQFSLLADPQLGSPGIIVPSLTQIYLNNPSYLTASFDDVTNTFSGFRQRYLNIDTATWADLPGTLDRDVSPIMPTSAAVTGATALLHDDATWEYFVRVHAGGVDRDVWPAATEGCDNRCRRQFVCTMLGANTAAYTSCLSVGPGKLSVKPRSISGGIVALMVLSCVLLVGAAGAAIYFFRKRRYGVIPDEMPFAQADIN